MASKHGIAAAIAGVLLVPLAPATASASALGVLACGTTITTSTVLTADVAGCAGDGLVVAGNRVTLDLNGHTVSGDGVPNATGFDVGLRVSGTDVQVRNGSVSAFDRGLLATVSPRLLVAGLAVHDNSNRGIMIDERSDGARIMNNVSSDNGASGIAVVASDRAQVTHNRSVRNVGGAGVRLQTADGALVADNHFNANTFGVQIDPEANGNTVTHNDLSGDIDAGVIINFSVRNVISHNRINHTNVGITLESADNTLITGNQILHMVGSDGIGIQIYGNRNLVARNTVVDTVRYGIEVDDFGDEGHSPAVDNVVGHNVVKGGGEGIAVGPEAGGVVLRTVIARNVVTGATDDGIQLVGPSVGLATSTVTRNVAVHNGDLGIEAVPGIIDGGGNHAAGNGNALQCLNIACR